MSTRTKTGGRSKGTPNKTTAARREVPAAAPAPDPFLPLAGARARGEADPPSPAASPFPRYKLARTDSLVPYARNARTHSEAQIAQIADSIREFGFTNPVLVDGKHGVIAGHGRVLAAKKLGMVEVPTIELSHLTAAQRRAYVIADNKVALNAGWDDELLALELGDLRDLGFDLALTGFEGVELSTLLGADDASAGADDPDAGALDGKVCCPACGHEFATVDKAFRLIAARKPKTAA